MTTRSNIVDYYGLFAFKDDLIDFACENFDDWKHREYSVKKDSRFNIYIKKLDEEILSEVPITVPDIFGQQESEGEDDEPRYLDANFMTPGTPEGAEDNTYQGQGQQTSVSEDWSNENWQGLLTKFFNKSRTHSFSIVKLYNAIPWWKVFTHREIQSIEYDHEVPVRATVKWVKDLPFCKNFIEYEEVLELTTANRLTDAILIPYGDADGNELGEFDMEPLWSLDVYLRYQTLDVVVNSAKSSGWHHFVYGEAMSEDKETDLKAAVDMVSMTRAVGAKESVLKEVRTVFPAKPEFTVMAKDDTLRDFASACRLPLSYFRAEIEHGGMFSLDNMDIWKINAKKKHIFGKFKNYIIKLIEMRWGIIIDDVFPNIEEIEQENYKEDIVIPAQEAEKNNEVTEKEAEIKNE